MYKNEVNESGECERAQAKFRSDAAERGGLGRAPSVPSDWLQAAGSGTTHIFTSQLRDSGIIYICGVHLYIDGMGIKVGNVRLD